MCVEELNRVNSRLTPRNVIETMLKAGDYVCICYARDDLIAAGITSGVKRARLQQQAFVWNK